MERYKYEDVLGEYARKLTRKYEAGGMDEVHYARMYEKLAEWMRYNKEANA